MSAAPLDNERWRGSEVVLLDIGKFLHCAPRVLHCQPISGARTTAASRPTSAMHAASPPVHRSRHQASDHRRGGTTRSARAVLSRLPQRFPPRIPGATATLAFQCFNCYPYALEGLTRLARDSWTDADFQDLIVGFPEETRKSADTLIAHVDELTRRDIKAVYLKQLQGHLWTTGFTNGDLKTPLFEDVVPTLEAWKAAGKILAIFSSGSVQAQLQFFSYVRDGQITRDIKPLFSAHYDTVKAGFKLEKSSYTKICSELGQDTSKVTFLTDNVKEAEAATEAGVYTVVVDRPGNAPLSNESKQRFPVIQKLTDLP
ncbi:Nn.00g078820.m01.CDS01 [Neocucurbitaria sp. VM-36]